MAGDMRHVQEGLEVVDYLDDCGDDDEYLEEAERASRRERRKGNQRKMKVDGASVKIFPRLRQKRDQETLRRD